jgi:hypothetical protein
MSFTREEIMALAGCALVLAFCATFYLMTSLGTLRLVPSIYDRPPPEPTPAVDSGHCEAVPGPQLIIYCTHS